MKPACCKILGIHEDVLRFSGISETVLGWGFGKNDFERRSSP